MKGKGILTIAGLVISGMVSAQTLDRSVVGTAGNVVTNSTMSLEYTVGETAIGSFSNTTNQLTTGFNQGYDEDNSSITPVLENATIKVFPNPAHAVLNINSALNGKVRILSFIGEVVVDDVNVQSGVIAQLDIANVSAGVYFVEVSDGVAVTRAKWIKD